MGWACVGLIGGVVAGFTNTLAGSGSVINLGLLLTAGLDIHLANGTNRIAILCQNALGAYLFHREGYLDLSATRRMLLPIVGGAIGGALTASFLPAHVFRGLVGPLFLLLLLALVLGVGPSSRPETDPEENAPPQPMGLARFLLLTAVGFYGGFIQVGVGLFLLSSLVMAFGFDTVRGNAAKVFLGLVFTLPALGVFAYRGQVDWVLGGVLALGNMLGAWIATRVAMEKGDPFIRRFLIVVLVLVILREASLYLPQ